LGSLDARITRWAEAANPFFAGPNADWLALIPFLLLAGFLYLTGRCWKAEGRMKNTESE
jgi:hypothetical protein